MSEEAVRVKALVGLEYDGRQYRAGDWFSARPVDALTMGQAGRVSLNREYATRALTAPQPRAEKPSRKKYRRRDLTADPS